jgi:hypothetical protein
VPRFEDDDWGTTVTVDPRRREFGHHVVRSDDVDAVRRGVYRVRAPQLPPPVRYRSPVREFVDKYGWRAYALPILVVITILALVTTGGSPKHRQTAAGASGTRPVTSAPPAAGSDIPLKTDTVSGDDSRQGVLKAAALPPGPAYTVRGKGTFRVLKGTTKVFGHGRLFHYDIEVENGITGVNLTEYQQLVDSTLADPRSWSGHGVALQRVDSGPVDFRISLTSSMTVRKWCGYSIPVETSCYAAAGSSNGVDVNRVVFNVSRWVRGATAYISDLHAYRQYMINHEDGHALGHEHAHQCLKDGLAPAMMQQTFGLRSATTGAMCGANPWPYPPGAKDAPGAEQADTPQNDEYGLAD